MANPFSLGKACVMSSLQAITCAELGESMQLQITRKADESSTEGVI